MQLLIDAKSGSICPTVQILLWFGHGESSYVNQRKKNSAGTSTFFSVGSGMLNSQDLRFSSFMI
jgi:hypothetical protein